MPDWYNLQQKDLSSLITYSRQLGLGEPITFQKTSYSQKDLEHLRILLSWWNLVNLISNKEWRDKITARIIQRNAILSLIENKPLEIYSIFCPSYKKGNGEYGYMGVIGNHTKAYIHKLSGFVKLSKELGLSIHATAYFSDLLLENYECIQGTTYKEDLKTNYLSFKREFLDVGNFVETKLLSSINELSKGIGEKGIRKGVINIPIEIFEKILERNKVFYINGLGWTNSMVKERTDILISSYSLMGLVFRKMYPNGIMFWVESAYERGVMYNGYDQDAPIPTIYPIKDD